jgi:hypothetical protein
MTRPFPQTLAFLLLYTLITTSTPSQNPSLNTHMTTKILQSPFALKFPGGCSTEAFHKLFPQNPSDTSKYIIEEHETTTSDGYILRLFRVNLSQKEQGKLLQKWQGNLGKVILIVHGLSDSSDSWFYNGEGESIGFKMVQEGYDVWLGNNRGNKYSHRHVNPEISDGEFFDFS